MTILIPEVISLETAKLAREKGFDVLVPNFYTDHTYLGKDVQYNPIGIVKRNYNAFKDKYSAPTQSLLQRWLRENHNIHIMICPKMTPSNEIVYYSFTGTKKKDWLNCYNTYEEVLELALVESLKSIY